MKKTLLAVAVGTTFLAPSIASAAPKVYGKFNFGLESTKEEIGNPGADAVWALNDNSNSSRLGVKGSDDLGIGGLEGFYQLEYGIDQFRDEGAPFSERNIFAGIKGSFGSLRFGGFDTSVKDIGSKIDLFNDQDLADFASILAGETRNKNLIQYTSPKLGDVFTFELTAQPGEGRTSATDSTDTDTGVADTFYAAAKFDLGMVKLNAAYAANETTSLKADKGAVGSQGKSIDIMRVTAQFIPFKDLQVGALYQLANEADDDSTAADESDNQDTSFVVSAGYTINAFTMKAEFGQTEGDVSSEKLTETAFGFDYKLSKSFMTQAHYVTIEQDSTSDKDTQYGVSVVYSF